MPSGCEWCAAPRRAARARRARTRDPRDGAGGSRSAARVPSPGRAVRSARASPTSSASGLLDERVHSRRELAPAVLGMGAGGRSVAGPSRHAWPASSSSETRAIATLVGRPVAGCSRRGRARVADAPIAASSIHFAPRQRAERGALQHPRSSSRPKGGAWREHNGIPRPTDPSRGRFGDEKRWVARREHARR